jgi:hypothetical protein
MAWWIYLGKVTTPVKGVTATLDERGTEPVIVPRDANVSTVLVPRLRFEAPMSSVAHLTRLKQVAALKPHQIPKPPKAEPVKAEPAKKEATTAAKPLVVASKREEKPKEVTSDGETPVVASNAAKEEPEASLDADDAGEEKSKVQQEKQKKGGTKGSSKRRG